MRHQQEQHDGRKQEFRENKNQQYHEHEDITTMKFNQSLPSQVNFLLFLLISISLIANTARAYDYNVVVGCGIYFLSTKNPFLHKMFYFYILVFLTICADALTIALLYGKINVFHSMIVPGIQILLKIFILIIQAFYWRKQSQQESMKMIKKSQQNAQLFKQIQEQKTFQNSKLLYQQSKLQQKPNPGNYYLPKYSNVLNTDREIYQTQQFREFDNQQFLDDNSEQEGRSRKN